MTSVKAVHGLDLGRRAGVLLHPTSLPGDFTQGDIGHQAYRFIEFLHAQGFKIWQMLPLGAPHNDKSPYQCLSAHAGNPCLISIDWLIDRGWLKRDKPERLVKDEQYRQECLKLAAEHFYSMNDAYWHQKINDYMEKHADWLEDYALFVAFKYKFDDKPWYEWPVAERHRDSLALEAARHELAEHIKQVKFEQFVFLTQWSEIRAYARKHKVQMFGDMPIFVARDSADVWALKDNFMIDADGKMELIAGVPPDAFSKTGQRWGNPLYDWDYMQQNKFAWWKLRFKNQLELFDILRIDHFRGLQACWYIPEADETAINGKWVEVPGDALLKEMFDSFESLPLVAEDLGVITDEVIALKDQFTLPGMKVLQFAFDGNNKNPHLPHHQLSHDVVYTGTHDNDTSLGWVMNETNYNPGFFKAYVASGFDNKEQAVMALIREAMASVSFMCVIPMQDLLMLDSNSRMNIPGTMIDNWLWRFSWEQLRPDLLKEVGLYMKLYQR